MPDNFVHSLDALAPYSSQVQQPRRAVAILRRRPHAPQTALFDREQGRAGSLHPGGVPWPCQNGAETRDTEM
jgi:hypothetical protein